MAALTVIKVLAELDEGNAVLWEDTLQLEPTLDGRLLSPTEDQPAGSVLGISISLTSPYLSEFQTRFQWPDTVALGAQYKIRNEARRRGKGELGDKVRANAGARLVSAWARAFDSLSVSGAAA